MKKPKTPSQLDKAELLTPPPLAEMQANESDWETFPSTQRFEKLSEDEKLSRLCLDADLRLVEVGQFFCALPSPRGEAEVV